MFFFVVCGVVCFFLKKKKKLLAPLSFQTGEASLQKKLRSLGHDVLRDPCDDDTLVRLRERPSMASRGITRVLMDQRILAGVGNYIKSEALYRAHIDPRKRLLEISDDDLRELFRKVREVTRESYFYGGTTIRDFFDLKGQPGTFSKRLRVYGKKVDPLGNEVIRNTLDDGRTTHWVPSVQVR